MDYTRLYDFRFRGVDQSARQKVWNIISRDIYERMGNPDVLLDPAAGRCEFINAAPARERWIVDQADHAEDRDPQIKAVIADVLTVDLPSEHFDGVFVSNFLEHLPTQEAVSEFLGKMFAATARGGKIAIIGPNFRYCYREYFDCADHTLALSHVAVEEHVYVAGFQIESVTARYLPFSFRGHLPASPALTRAYLRLSLARRLFGKQFLVIASKA